MNSEWLQKIKVGDTVCVNESYGSGYWVAKVSRLTATQIIISRPNGAGGGDECPNCGCDAEVLTDSGRDNCAFDGDDARCPECKMTGCVCVYTDEDEPYSASISWAEESSPPTSEGK